jgi:hypothetical protein
VQQRADDAKAIFADKVSLMHPSITNGGSIMEAINWDAVAALSEALGVIAIVGSLIFVGIQIRQNSKMVAAQTFQAISSTSAEYTFRMAEDPDITNLISEVYGDGEGLTRKQLTRIDVLLRALYRNFENYFHQYDRGFLEADMWEGYRQTMLAGLVGDVGREWWSRNKIGFGKRYHEFIDSELETFAPPDRPWVGGNLGDD